MILSYSTVRSVFFPIVISILIFSLVADTLIAKVYVFTTNQSFSNWRIASFAIISIIFVVSQYFILQFIKQRIKEIETKKQSSLIKIHTVVTIVQYSIAIIVAILNIQMITTNQYYNAEVIICITISLGLSIFLLSLLSFRFFTWFKVNRSTIVLLYAISTGLITINASLTIVFVDTIMFQQPAISRPHYGSVHPPQFLLSMSITSIINYAFILSSILAFLSFWVATSLLLRHYSDKLGRVKYWILLSIPLIYFILQFLPSFVNLFLEELKANPISTGIAYTIVFTISKPVGGILFGIAFWSIARTLSRNSKVRRYFIMASFGIILLFTSNQAIIIVTFTYPAFGLVTTSTMGLASYLLFLGIYASAISVAQDEKLRHSIRKFALEESKLLGSIASAQKEKELEILVLKVIEDTKATLKEDTGVEASIEKDDMIEYTKHVIREIKRKSID